VAQLFAGTADLVVGSRLCKGRVDARLAGMAAAGVTSGGHLPIRSLVFMTPWAGFFAIVRSRLLELAPQTSGFKIVFETMLRAGNAARP